MTLDQSNDRPPVQIQSGIIYLRASTLGDCPRSIAALILGHKAPPASEALMISAEEGHLHEPAVARKIEQEYPGFHLVNPQGTCEQDYKVGDMRFRITGHYEGIWALGNDAMFGWECKSKSEAQFKLWMQSVVNGVPTFSKHPGHAWQISHYMSCHGLPVLYTVKNRNTGELSITILKEAPYGRTAIHDRLGQVARIVGGYAADRTVLYDNSYCDPDANKWQCSHRDVLSCLAILPGLDGVEEVDDDELDGWLMVYRSLLDDEGRIKKQKAELSEKIKARVGAGKVQTLTGFTASITPYDKEDREKLAAFLKDHGVGFEDFKTKGRRLNVKGPKGYA